MVMQQGTARKGKIWWAVLEEKAEEQGPMGLGMREFVLKSTDW